MRTVSLEMSFPRCVGRPKRVSSLPVTRFPTSEGGVFFSPPGLPVHDCHVRQASYTFACRGYVSTFALLLQFCLST